jgi:hypothetical protein
MQLGRLEAPVGPGLRAAIEAFDCGNPEVNGYLQRYAETIVAHGLGTMLVLTDGKEILGFVSLSFSSIVLTNSEKGTFRGPDCVRRAENRQHRNGRRPPREIVRLDAASRHGGPGAQSVRFRRRPFPGGGRE